MKIIVNLRGKELRLSNKMGTDNKIIWTRGEVEALIGRNFTGEFNSFEEIQKVLDGFEKVIMKKVTDGLRLEMYKFNADDFRSFKDLKWLDKFEENLAK